VTTLAQVLADHRVSFDVLHQRYKPVLGLVDVLIGVVPNCDPYLEIWQPGFRTYNLMVPNFLNLPISLTNRSGLKGLVGLGMYASSRAADCAYCSAHTCSFALRRGSSEDSVTGKVRTPAEAAVWAYAEGLSTVPHTYDPALEVELRRHLDDDGVEWVTMGIVMMGFLNKFMDAIGVELEAASVDDVGRLIEPTGWSVGQHAWAAEDGLVADPEAAAPDVDSLSLALPLLRNAPGAVRLERGWLAGLPKGADEAFAHISGLGFPEPTLRELKFNRVRRALTGMLHHNLDPAQTSVGIGNKALVGLVFGAVADSDAVIEANRSLAAHHEVASEAVEAALAVGRASDPAAASADLDPQLGGLLRLAAAMSPSPAAVTADDVAFAETLPPADVVELAVWVSVSQLLHRLHVRRAAPVTVGS
jgi:hypothetical protein